MLVTLKEILTKAKQENYAVPACNIDNEHNLRAAIEAAEEMNTGIILNTTRLPIRIWKALDELQWILPDAPE